MGWGRAQSRVLELEQGKCPNRAPLTSSPGARGVRRHLGKSAHRLVGHGPQGKQVQVLVGVDEALSRGRAPDESPTGEGPHEGHDEDRHQGRRPADEQRELLDGAHEVGPGLLDVGSRAGGGPEGASEAVIKEGQVVDTVTRCRELLAEPGAGSLELTTRLREGHRHLMNLATNPGPQGDPGQESQVGQDLDESTSGQVCIELHGS